MHTHIYIYVLYEYIASAGMTPVLRETVLLLFEPRRFVATKYSKNVSRRVCGDFLKPCLKHICSGYLFGMYYTLT